MIGLLGFSPSSDFCARAHVEPRRGAVINSGDVPKTHINKEFTIIRQALTSRSTRDASRKENLDRALGTAVLKNARKFLVLSASVIMTSSIGSAADLRLKIDPTAARQGTAPGTTSTPKPKTRKQLFEEFLQW